ncbi:hypothetical protein JXA32_16225 [Candidatus Sumerlaeota bacterium]|nr:hypothetical protein [Candidatus Sumerlaeota bacterium]
MIFQARESLFLWNLRFFTDFTGRPGTLLLWVDSLLVQLCYFGWPGALALAAAVWLLLVSTIGLMNASGRADIGGTWIIPGIILVGMHNDYYFFHTSLSAGLALAMTAANGWVRIPSPRIWLRLPLFTALSIVVYHLTGAFNYYCFAACCVIHEALAEKRRLPGALMLLIGIAVKFGLDAVLIRFDLFTRNFQPPVLETKLNYPPVWQLALLYGYFPACMLFVIYRETAGNAARTFWQKLRGTFGKKVSRKEAKNKKRKKAARNDAEQSIAPANRFGWFRWTASTLLILAAAAAAGFYTLDRNKKLLLEINYCTDHQMWEDVLKKARELPRPVFKNSLEANHNVNLAMYHTGRLPYEMLFFPQSVKNWTLINYLRLPNQMINKPCDVYLELGRVNEAEHILIEFMEKWPTGGAYKRMAFVKMIKGQPSAAKTYLNVLRDDLVWRSWAQAYLERLAKDPDLSDDEEIQQIRRLMITKDDLHQTGKYSSDDRFGINFSAILLSQLRQNDHNKMAYEYLMAQCLIAGNVDGVVELFFVLDNFSYPGIPTLYEEAAIIYASKHPEELVNNQSGVFFRGRKISETTFNKYLRYEAFLKKQSTPSKEVGAAMARQLEGSYFPYYYWLHLGEMNE